METQVFRVDEGGRPSIAEPPGADFGMLAALDRPGTISRDRLLSRLLRSSAANCVLVVAPGGYGKTTLLAEWAAAGERDVAWATLDERHDDPALLIAAIAGALERMVQMDDAILAPLASPQPDVARTVVPRLCGHLASGPGLAVVLDDVHLVRSATGREVIARFAECLPPAHQLAMAAREEPRVRLGRLRTERLTVELGADDLAMTRSEASRLFRACGHPQDREIVSRLVDRTEGWPAALYLAGMWLEREGDPERALARFTGDDRIVADYLRDEFLNRVDGATLDFLIRSSVLDRLSGDVCDFVLEREGSAAQLRRLARSNLLLVPLDRRDREYRYHALLREMLSAELHARGERFERELHARASIWYAGSGDPDRAVDHAIASGDIDAAGRLIWASMPAYSSSGRQRTLVRWLSAFSDEELAGSVALSVTAAIVAMVDADESRVQRWALAGESALGPAERPDEAELRAGIAMILRIAGTAKGVRATAEELADLRSRLPADLPWRLLCCLGEGVMHHLAGDRDAARRVLDEAVGMGSAVAPSPYALALVQLALIALDGGDLEEARAQVHRALKTVEHFGLEGYATSSMIFAVAALVSARSGDSGQAARCLAVGEDLLAGARDLYRWIDAVARIALARASIMLDEVSAAREHLRAARRSAARLEDAVVLDEWLVLAGEEADAAVADGDRWPLTPAEIRLLHHLPTHHTFPEIGEQLFVSTNTVKTQAQSIYRKFNVSSRAEAVEVARAAGLLNGDPDDR